MKNELISKALKKRWASKTKKQRSEYGTKMAIARAKKMTKEQRSAHAKMMIEKRYAKN